MGSTDTPPLADAQPAYERLQDEGAFYRRRVSVPREASLVHRVLAPIAEDLNGRVYDDDGRVLIEWLERFWPYEIAGHGRSDGFRWSVTGSKDGASILVLVTQSLLGERKEFALDVIVAPQDGLTAVPPAIDVLQGEEVSSRSRREGVHFWTEGELFALHEDRVSALVRRGVAAIASAPLLGRETPTPRRPSRARSTLSRGQWATAVGFVLTAVLALGLFAGEGLAEAVIGTLLIVGATGLWLIVQAKRRDVLGRNGRERCERASGPRSYNKDAPPRARGADERVARLEEGRDIRDYVWGDG